MRARPTGTSQRYEPGSLPSRPGPQRLPTIGRILACASLRSSRKVARPTAAERLHVAGADGSSALQPAVREQMPRTSRSAIHRPGDRTNIEHFTECASGFFLLLLLLFHDFPDPGNFPRLRVQISPRTHGVEVPRDTSPGIGWVPASKATPPRASASRSR